MQPVKIAAVAFLTAFGLSTCFITYGEAPAAKPAKAALRVGVFDSRAVAVAYARSAAFSAEIKRLKQQCDQARAAGNDAEVKRLNAEGSSRQVRLHRQGFSSASVENILETVKEQLPAIAEQAAVDLIVSKWDLAYRAPDAETVDVTALLIKPFSPDKKTLQIVEQLAKVAPIPADQLKIDVND